MSQLWVTRKKLAETIYDNEVVDASSDIFYDDTETLGDAVDEGDALSPRIFAGDFIDEEDVPMDVESDPIEAEIAKMEAALAAIKALHGKR